MGRRYEQMMKLDDGWCEWRAPISGYRMGCCDCGLVHEMEFKIVQQIGPEERDGTFPTRTPRTKGLRVVFRAKRDKRATAGKRRRTKTEGTR